MKKEAGILLPVASLPSNHGIGDFGESAYTFIDMLSKTKNRFWQILPLNPLGYGNSPYQPYSSKAMDELYINLDLLKKDGLIKTAPNFQKNAIKIDYDQVRLFKQPYLKEAFHNFKPNKAFKAFKQIQWVYHYGVFITLKKHNDLKCWNEWKEEHQNWIKDQAFDISIYQEEIEYEIFIQFILLEQWNKLKKYANKKHVEIIGDIPIYVGIDSLDVWENQCTFLLDDHSRPTFIAGVPPDYFSKEGQRWGNPLYDWEYLEKQGFDFWLDRLDYCRKIFDYVRIDHFRAFDTYWKIPASCPTAIEGEWKEAPGYALFDTIFQKMPDIKIIAEDLGDLRPQVYDLRDHYHFMGMRIVQFTWKPSENEFWDNKTHMIAYTGSHDNQTVDGWYTSQDEQTKKLAKTFFKQKGYTYSKMAHNFVAYTLDSDANWAIIPIQDYLAMNDRSRINTPGTIGSPNWEFKLKDFKSLEAHLDLIKQMIHKSQRAV